jgi:hypothetical protein
MFLGRPVNQWNGLITAAVTLAIVVISATQTDAIAKEWSIILGAVGVFLGILVAFLAGQPPTLNPGDTFTTQTAKGTPNYVTTVAQPPAADPPPAPVV